MQLLMSRYILEIEKDPSLLKKFSNNYWYPNFDKYRTFIHKQERNNHSFAKTIDRYRLVKPNEHIIETVSSKELESVSFYLNKEAILIESGYGTIKCSGEIPNMIYPCCYISNGFYHDTQDLCLKMINYGSFIVGVCDNTNSIFFQENLKRIEDFKKTLQKKHVGYKTYSHNNHRDKTLILYYRSETL